MKKLKMQRGSVSLNYKKIYEKGEESGGG